MTGIEIIYKLVAIILSLGILFTALMFKMHTRSWVSPAVLFALFWFLFTFFPLTVMFVVPINPLTILFIWSCVLLFGLPVLFLGWKNPLGVNAQKIILAPQLYAGDFLPVCFYGLQFTVLLCILMNLSVQGFSPQEFITDLFGTANRYLAARYNGDITPNIFSQAGVVLNYVGVCIGGLILTGRKTFFRKLSVFVMSFTPAALHMLIYADKGTLFLCAALLYSGVLIKRMHEGDTSLTNRQTNRVVFVSLLALLPVLVASFMARGIGEGSTSETVDRLMFYMASYAFGHLYTFSDWFSYFVFSESTNVYQKQSDYTYGLYTFTAIFKAFGSQVYIPEGFYDEYYNYNDIIQSNIYTIFRGLIQDFSYVGALLYMIITGVIFHSAYYRVLVCDKPTFSVAAFMCLVGYIYTSFIISIMVWKSFFALFVVLSIVLSVNKILYKGRLDKDGGRSRV